MDKLIYPSLLAFNLRKIEPQILDCARHGVKCIHYDVMDGEYVSNTAFNTEFLSLIHMYQMKTNVHLMTKRVVSQVKKYLDIPCVESILIHPDADNVENIQAAFKLIRSSSRPIKVGLALKNSVAFDQATIALLQQVDLVLMMGVKPGAGGQAYMPISTDKLRQLKQLIVDMNLNIPIILDGGVNFEVIEQTKAYVDIYVIGTFLMNHDHFAYQYQKLVQQLS